MKRAAVKKVKKPSKSLTQKINAFNKLNESTNKKLNTKREAIIKQAQKEGFNVNVR